MSYYKDLEDCTYFNGIDFSRKKILAIGWLDNKHEFQKGNCQEVFLKKLETILVQPWQPVVCMGFHKCELCSDINESGNILDSERYGNNNIFVPHNDIIFAAPELVLHYIKTHNYKPAKEFIDAVLVCPGMDTDEYYDSLSLFNQYRI